MARPNNTLEGDPVTIDKSAEVAEKERIIAVKLEIRAEAAKDDLVRDDDKIAKLGVSIGETWYRHAGTLFHVTPGSEAEERLKEAGAHPIVD